VASPKFKWRALLAFVHDGLAVLVAWYLAFLFRFNFEIPPLYGQSLSLALRLITPIALLIFWRAGLYRGLWRYASLPDMQRILVAVLLVALAAPVTLMLLQVTPQLPRSTLLLAPILLFGIMCGSRIAYRAFKERSLYRLTHLKGDPVLILGAGDIGIRLVKDLQRSLDWRVVGILDDDPVKVGRLLQGVSVLGRLDELARWSRRLGARCAIIAMPSATRLERRRAMDLCAAAGVRVFTVPSLEDVMAGRVSAAQIRPIEIEDLLGRDPVQIDNPGLTLFLANQVAMVTGAGGSIGSALCRQIAAYRPSLLVFFEASEFALYQIQEEFAEFFRDVPVVALIGDVKNRARVAQVLEQYRPSVVFHAAAYKHVPLMEEVNAWEAVRNNVLGTYCAAEAAIAHGAKAFVMVSTDKAVNPTNVMGASKRLAEMVCQKLQAGSNTRFEMVRFGNVLASAGSVIPKFHEQIARGGPVTVTHPEIIRYFMSIPEAAQLLLQAGAMGRGGDIFVMDMGEPVRIADLAQQMIRLSGFTEEDIKIVYTGLRPGEKLFEELLADDEHTRPSDHPKLRIAKARDVIDWDMVDLLHWLEQPATPDDDEVRRDLRRWVPEYSSAQRPQLRVIASGAAL
jgi:FlaA1/EpsC-like NDP-sugar epimerase